MHRWNSQSESLAGQEEFCRFVARQPILNRLRRTYGYELLFRTSWENRFAADGELASHQMIDNAVSFGMDSLVGDCVPFVNCTRDILLKGLPTLLPRETVLEVLETVEVDDELVAACKRLCALGYKLALDDYDFSPQWTPLLSLISFIKVDLRCTPSRQRVELMRQLRFYPIQFIAEKVEDEAEFNMALNEGFHFFQGYFFTKPVVLGRPALNTIINRLRFFAELNKPGFNATEVLRLLKEEPTVTYRLLRMANSAAVGAREPVKSLRTALVLVGEEQFRKLAFTAVSSELCGGQTAETLNMLLQKARFCELMAPVLNVDGAELYLFGMLAALKSMLELSSTDVTHTLRLCPSLAAALQGEQNEGAFLLQAFDGHCRGDWMGFSEATTQLGCKEEAVSQHCRAAQQWAAGILAVVLPSSADQVSQERPAMKR